MIKQLHPQYYFIPARIILFLLDVVAAMADGRKTIWNPRKRHLGAAGSGGGGGIELVDLRAAYDELAEERRLLLLPLQLVYNMRVNAHACVREYPCACVREWCACIYALGRICVSSAEQACAWPNMYALEYILTEYILAWSLSAGVTSSCH